MKWFSKDFRRGFMSVLGHKYTMIFTLVYVVAFIAYLIVVPQ